jgi:hypothetical protein
MPSFIAWPVDLRIAALDRRPRLLEHHHPDLRPGRAHVAGLGVARAPAAVGDEAVVDAHGVLGRAADRVACVEVDLIDVAAVDLLGERPADQLPDAGRVDARDGLDRREEVAVAQVALLHVVRVDVRGVACALVVERAGEALLGHRRVVHDGAVLQRVLAGGRVDEAGEHARGRRVAHCPLQPQRERGGGGVRLRRGGARGRRALGVGDGGLFALGHRGRS